MLLLRSRDITATDWLFGGSAWRILQPKKARKIMYLLFLPQLEIVIPGLNVKGKMTMKESKDWVGSYCTKP